MVLTDGRGGAPMTFLSFWPQREDDLQGILTMGYIKGRESQVPVVELIDTD